MKLRKTKAALLAAVAGSALLAAGTAKAQNSAHGPLDMVLHFQKTGGTGSNQVVLVSLGGLQSVIRDGGTFTSININTQLNTFGSTWYDETTLWMGAVGFYGSSDTSTLLAFGDPTRTIYATQARNSVGTVGVANSVVPAIANDGAMTIGANNINTVKAGIEAVSGNNRAVVLSTSNSSVDEQNTFLAGNQSTAYGIFASGVQDNFFSGSLGNFGSAGTVELALDVYRYQARNDISGQYGFGEANRVGDYMGTITINQSGDVNYISAVPEPSTALLGLGAAFSLLVMRRRRAVSLIS